ncbi:aldehyde dehydrogenase family protein [Psychromarinibacter halotolerans]|uniref:Aldehyde dehydrogenase family protein n=1 Tax=Psychromarinibacter halotolerans TaxID=1775175 RepID=A0ABV7GXR2_9RHOB|nr:aldehyde dehydrogenase family protein [Psychromarinibacter halotolerans]MDF0597978.1 aldehyde dehydrogenase family protein [Psychromarinibacter halotolerans]
MNEQAKIMAADLPALADTPANFIGGAWENAESGTFPVVNPATGETIALLPASSRATAHRAIEAANAAQPAWAKVPLWDRAALCVKLADAIDANLEDLARVLSMEQGKPLAQSMGEVGKAADGFRMNAELVKYMTGETIPGETPNRQVITRRFPRGVYAVITPWNFPVNIPTEYLAPAIATGNTVVWVPAPTTSLVAVAFMRVLAEAGLPEGLINLVLGEGATVGDEIVVNPGTHAIGFTGSAATGKRIAERGAGKPMLLELGGNGPMIVRADADLDKAAAAAADGAFGNAGQICAATGRVLAHVDVATPLAEKIAEHARAHVVGDPMHQGTTMGPLNNAAVATKVAQHVTEAIADGARVLAGGKALPEAGSDLFYAPTVLDGVTPEMRIAREETFGPIVPVIALGDDAELMRVAKDTEYGLSMSIFSNDIETAMAMSGELSAGIVNINEGTTYWEIHMPFGGGSGTKSGIGRIGGKHTLEAMTEVRSVSVPLPHFG